MKYFFEIFKERLINAVRTDFEKFVQQCENEVIYACALVTDSDARTLYLAINTNEYLKSKIQTDEDVKYMSYYKWTPAEWKCGNNSLSGSLVNEVSNLLGKEEESIDQSQFELHIRNVHDNMISSLKELVSEGYFSSVNSYDKFTLFVSISDDQKTRELESYSAKELNSSTIANDFVNRFN